MSVISYHLHWIVLYFSSPLYGWIYSEKVYNCVITKRYKGYSVDEFWQCDLTSVYENELRKTVINKEIRKDSNQSLKILEVFSFHINENSE